MDYPRAVLQRLFYLLLISFVMWSCAAEPETKKNEKLFSDFKPAPSHVDSIEVGKKIPFISTDTFSLIESNTHTLTYSEKPLSTGNVFPEKNTLSFRPKKPDTIFQVAPITKEVNPFIAHLSHPSPLKAGEMRSTKTGGENIQYLDVEQGLASSHVNCMVQDPFGFLWFGLNNGLTRYDGNYLVHYTTDHGLPHNYVQELYFDSKKNLWIGTRSGLVKYDGIQLEIYNTQTGLRGNDVGDIVEDSSGHIWFTTDGGGLERLHGRELTQYSDSTGLKMNAIVCLGVDERDRIFIGYFGSAPDFLDQNNTITRYHYAWDFFGSDIQNSVFKDKDNRLWLANYSGGACRISEHDSAYRYMPNTGIHYRSLNEIEQDQKGRMWFGSIEAGLAYLENGKYTAYTVKQGLSSNYVTDLLEDKAGNMWVSTLGGGVNKINPQSFRLYTNADGLSDKNVSCIHENTRGDIVFGTWADGPWIFDDTVFYHPKRHIEGIIVFDMEEDYFGNTILGAHQHGTYMLKPSQHDSATYESFQTLHDNPRFRPFGIRKIIRDTEDNLWMLDDTYGIYKLVLAEDKSHYAYCDRYTTANGLHTNTMVYGAIDSTGTIWVSQYNMGISAIKNETITHYTVKNDLPSNLIRSMYVDHDNRLWLASDKGVTILDNGIFTNITVKDNLSNNSVTSFVEDHKGRMWVGTQNGLNLLTHDPSSSCGFAITSFSTKDGLRSTDFLQHAAIMDHDHNLWWSTRSCVVKLNLNTFDKITIQPDVEIINIDLMGTTVDFSQLLKSSEKNEPYYSSDSLTDLSAIKPGKMKPFYNIPESLILPHYVSNVTFHYSAMNGISGHELNYRTRLIGRDEHWSSWSSSSETKFDNLPPGKYVFELQSRVIHKEPGKTVSYAFEIKPPFWQTWWFRILIFAILILIIYFIFKWRNYALIERQKQLEATVTERTQEIQFQKTLIEEKQIEILDSINYAQRIQRALLATDEILEKNLPEHFVFFQPKDIVSGDFYWATENNDGQFLLMVADSTGHGVPGAIMSMLNISALERAIESEKLIQPADVLNSVRQKIISTLSKDGSAEGGKDGMDCSLILFDFKNMELHFSGANNTIWILRNSKMLSFEPDRMPVGKHIRDKIPFSQITVPLVKNDLIYLFTDGYADQFGGDGQSHGKPGGKKFKYTRLQSKLIEIAQLPMHEQAVQLKSTFTAWKGDLEQVDDVCIVGVRI